MSFMVETVRIDAIDPHPNADALSLATIQGWTVCIHKDKYKVGDIVVYFPIDSILPLELSDRLKVTAHLNKQKVRAVKLRGIISFGLVMENEENWPEGTDVTDHFGVKKYEPPPPPFSMRGQQARQPEMFYCYTRINNFNKYNKILQHGEEIVATEKIHGTSFRAGLINNEFLVGSHYCAMKPDDKIVYWRAAWHNNLEEKMRKHLAEQGEGNWMLYGEVYGKGIQDLDYGVNDGVQLRLFDISYCGQYIDYDHFESNSKEMDLPIVPLVYRGPMDVELLTKHAEGKAFQGDHIKEGVVVRPIKERWDNRLGRVILKKINPEYSIRNKGTEYH